MVRSKGEVRATVKPFIVHHVIMDAFLEYGNNGNLLEVSECWEVEMCRTVYDVSRSFRP